MPKIIVFLLVLLFPAFAYALEQKSFAAKSNQPPNIKTHKTHKKIHAQRPSKAQKTRLSSSRTAHTAHNKLVASAGSVSHKAEPHKAESHKVESHKVESHKLVSHKTVVSHVVVAHASHKELHQNQSKYVSAAHTHQVHAHQAHTHEPPHIQVQHHHLVSKSIDEVHESDHEDHTAVAQELPTKEQRQYVYHQHQQLLHQQPHHYAYYHTPQLQLDWDDDDAIVVNKAAAPLSDNNKVNNLLRYATSFVGSRYRFGGDSPRTGFDCSGYVKYVFKHQFGISLPHNAAAISRFGSKIPSSQLRPGDLVLFTTLRKNFGHVGIYIGHNHFVHAANSRVGIVEISDIRSTYWARNFRGGRRLLNS